MASPGALRDWCRATCASYPNVDITNMTSSFRDGLAFCAIIHKHRPDLLEFSSLSKDNIYQNNKLAFEVAETKLGIPALLDPKDMVSTKVPDCLSILAYLSQYYHFFNRKSYAGLPSLRSPHVTALNNREISKTPEDVKALKGSTHLETIREDCLSNTRPRTMCNLCFKPIHLIQRHLVDGKIYHRSCFRCNVCHSTLLHGSYTRGSDAGSLICSLHITDSKTVRVQLNQQTESTKESYFSLGGLAVSSIPHYAKTTESQDRLVCGTTVTDSRERQEKSAEVRGRENGDTAGLKSTGKKSAAPHPPPRRALSRAVEGAGTAGTTGTTGTSGTAGPAPAAAAGNGEIRQEASKAQQLSDASSLCAEVKEESRRPVPAPRRMLNASAAAAPGSGASGTKAPPTTNSSHVAGNPNKCSPNSSHIPTSARPKVNINHPWLTIIHPGPWTQLPRAPPPLPKSAYSTQNAWHRTKERPQNPFREEEEEEEEEERPDKPNPPKKADFTAAGGVVDTVGASSEPSGDTSQIGSSELDETGNTGGSLVKQTEAATAAAAAEGPHGFSDEAQGHVLSRSLSVPAITSAQDQSSFSLHGMTEANECDQVTSCQSKAACKENPFDRKPAMVKSKSYQMLPSKQASAPGHGFPLIKRKVQTEQDVSTEGLQMEMSELDKHLEALERRGVQLERSLRDGQNEKEEGQMLMEWFSLFYNRHVLMRKATELVYLTKQQKLEERQADVEYELRCLLNKPDGDWTQEDRDQEQQMMDELVAIIDQRNQIISCLDQDRQREKEECVLLEAMNKNKEVQKEGLKELKKSKGKFNPTSVFKMLNHKTRSTKDSTEKNN